MPNITTNHAVTYTNFICSFHWFFVNSVILHNLTLQRVISPSSFVILYNALNTLVYLRCCSTGSLWKYIIPLEISVPYKNNVSIQCRIALRFLIWVMRFVWFSKIAKLNGLKWRDVFGYYSDRARHFWKRGARELSSCCTQRKNLCYLGYISGSTLSVNLLRWDEG